MKDKIIVLAGGVGPQSGLKIHEYIIANTEAYGTDQGHLDVYHFSRPGAIPDRTEALMSDQCETIVAGMLKTIQIAEASIDASGRQAVGAVLCNTFHAPSIMQPFLRSIELYGFKIRMLHLIDETLDYLVSQHSHCGTIGVMSTNGTRLSKIYENGLLERGFNVLQLPSILQHELHESIHNPVWGIKSQTELNEKVRHNFLNYIDWLILNGAEAIILGCTEIPLAIPEACIQNTPLVDPLRILARALVRDAAPQKLKLVPDSSVQTATA